jgi:hypothetical protein
MATEDLYPDAEVLYELLLTQLRYLKDRDGLIAGNRKSIRTTYENMKEMEPTDYELNIKPNWELRFGGDTEADSNQQSRRDFHNAQGIALIGGRVIVDAGDIKHYETNLVLLTQAETDTRAGDSPCCWEHDEMNEEWRVARRYHFDIETVTLEGEDDPKPVTHMQTGGNFDGQPVAGHDPHYCTSPLDKPRLPHPPMDPLLILHTLATQYDGLEPLIEDQWIGYVKDSENKLWEPYHEAILGQYRTEETRKTMAGFFMNG